MKKLLTFIFLLPIASTALFAQAPPLPSRVVDGQGKPVAGAQISFTRLPRDSGMSVLTVTDRDGYYDDVVPMPGKYKVQVSAFGFKTTTDTVQVKAGVANRLNTRLNPDPKDNLYNYSVKNDSIRRIKPAPGNFTFIIANEAGQPIPSAEILVRQDDSIFLRDVAGRYGMYSSSRPLPAGDYDVQFSAIGYVTLWDKIHLDANSGPIQGKVLAIDTDYIAQGNPNRRKGTPPPGDLLVVVTDAGAQPIAGASVSLLDYMGPPPPGGDETSETGKKGMDTLKYVGGNPATRYLLISKGGYDISYTVNVQVKPTGVTTIEKVLHPNTAQLKGQGDVQPIRDYMNPMPPGMFTLKVTGAKNEGIASAGVSVLQDDHPIYTTKTSRKGNALIKPLPPGEYRIVTDYREVWLTVL